MNASDERLAERVRFVIGRRRLEEKRMFGGLAFLYRGYMSLGILGEDLMVRVGPDAYEASLARAGARPMDFTGRPMKGMVYVGPAGTRTRRQLEKWVELALAFAASLPPRK